MILLDSQAILAATRRSLETHVLPTVTDEFTRTQVDAAIVALSEVCHRLENGDPYIAVNARIEAAMAELADQVRDDAPEVAALLDAALAGATGVDDPRERNRRLGESLTDVLGIADPATDRVRQLLSQDAGQVAAEDGMWMCASAIDSLQ